MSDSVISSDCETNLKDINLKLFTENRVDLFDSYTCSVHESIEELSEFWDMLSNGEVLMESKYLRVLERFPIEDLKYRYGIIHRDNKPVGIIYWQIKQFDLHKSLDIHTHSKNLFTKLWVTIKSATSRLIKDNLLVVGNVSLTGDFGFRFCTSVSHTDQNAILDKACMELIRSEKKNDLKIKSIMVKDFEIGKSDSRFENTQYTPYSADPTMILEMRPEWKSFDDYLSDHKSKARVRVKRAKKLGSELETREFSLEEIIQYNPSIYGLYKKIASYSSFNLFTLHPQYFVELKRALGDQFKMYGVFVEGEFVAFYSTIINHGMMHGHFLGYDQDVNAKYQLYLNILYWLVDLAIDSKATSLELSRTALEIKSSVGATPIALAVYVRAKNATLNNLMKKVVPLFIPENNWMERSPFKS